MILDMLYAYTHCRWPLIIDANQQAATFLRYRDTNYLNVCSPKHMEPDTIRMALLGAIRFVHVYIGNGKLLKKSKFSSLFLAVIL